MAQDSQPRLKESINLKHRKARLNNHMGTETEVSVTLREWSQREALRRGFWKSARICLTLLLVALPFGALEPFLFVIWGGSLFFVTVFLIGPFLHFTFAGNRVTIEKIEGPCQSCFQEGGVQTFVSEAFASEVSVICVLCGHTGKMLFREPSPDTETQIKALTADSREAS